ncbi:MAG: hypothetical protein JOZ31_04080 [Verrucomicrobia bacterium]|nr:hypothetical protein [Verrucomicrobiota bacterium]
MARAVYRRIPIRVSFPNSKNARVRITATGKKATILRLKAPSAESKTGITFGGASVDANGKWAPRFTESMRLRSDRLTVELPASSAVVVEIQSGRPGGQSALPRLPMCVNL